jgi:hypothetical protein
MAHAMSERTHKDCKYCGENILSSSMSSHLKQKHADEVEREEKRKQMRDNTAHWNAGKPQTKGTRGKDGKNNEKPQDGAAGTLEVKSSRASRSLSA